MSEIWNLSEVCRCCHSSGVFKSLLDEFMHDGNVEVYSDLLRDVLAIEIQQPPFAASHTICDQCIMQLRFCWNFKRQVQECERKFEEYCKNELFNMSGGVKVEEDNGGDISSGEYNYCEPLEVNSNTPEVNCETEQSGNPKGRSKKRKRGRPKTSNLTRREQLCEAARRFREKKLLATKRNEDNGMTGTAPSCNICELTFKSENIQALHMKKHISTKNGHRCQHCNKYYGSKEALVNHTNSHMYEDLYKCDVCLKKFPHKYTLRSHIEWHKAQVKEIPVNKCEICLLFFKNSSELRSHKINRHNILKVREQRKKITKSARGPYVCVECKQTFTTSFAMRRHSVMHTGLRPYKCELCPMTFITPDTLRYHVTRKHIMHAIQKRPNKCELCPMTFTSPDTLRNHVTIKHMNSEQKKCTICNKQYKDWKSHQKLHERPFKCDQCPKTFPAGNALNAHVKFVHLGIRPHACDYCEVKHATVRNLRRHLLKCHNVDMVKTKANDRTKELSKFGDNI